jgi:hypothetical protein
LVGCGQAKIHLDVGFNPFKTNDAEYEDEPRAPLLHKEFYACNELDKEQCVNKRD